eukprot:1144903-Pelagomonas_calceolata.AAC.4
MGLHMVFLGAVGLSMGYAHLYALLELYTCLSILWLLNTYLIAILASMEHMNVASLYASAKLPSEAGTAM